MKENTKGYKPYQKEEKEIMDSLVLAFNKFIKLEQTHPSHISDFVQGIHLCQSQIMNRILQRDYPEVFPTHVVDNKKSDSTYYSELTTMIEDVDTNTVLNININSI